MADDPNLAPGVRSFLVQLDKNASPFWTLPQPKPQEVLTALQNETPVDMSGVTTIEQSLTVDGRAIKLFIMKPDRVAGHPGVILFLHGAVWIAGNFENHKRLVRDLVVESGQPAVFPEITNLPVGKYPVPMDQAYATLEWIAAHASEFGADPRRIAVVGNSVGGDMTAALNLMAKDRKGPKISYQVLLWPATNAGVDTCSYQQYANGRFLPKAFMKYGWDLYAPTERSAKILMFRRCVRVWLNCRGFPPLSSSPMKTMCCATKARPMRTVCKTRACRPCPRATTEPFMISDC